MTETTEAAVLYELGKPLRLTRLSLPPLKPGQVLVEMAYSGVCHTQLSEARGRRGADRFLPHTLGHEGSGTVKAVADGVAKVRPGDRVVVSWIQGKGAAVPGTIYAGPDGPVNSGAVSTFMRLTVTCENRLTPVPGAMPLREASLLGCAVPTGAGIALNTAKVSPGQDVAVFGVGGIGLSAVMGASLRGARTVIAVDVFDHKLEQARALGATHAINSRSQDPLSEIQKLTNGRGVDCAIEAAGRRETMEAAFKATRAAGGLCVLAGNLPAGETIAIDPMDLIRGKRLIGTWGGETDPDRDIPLYAGLHQQGKLNLKALITREYPLARINEALDDLEAGRLARALISFGT